MGKLIWHPYTGALLMRGTMPEEKPVPGKLYKAICIAPHIFHVYYGYANGSRNERDIIPLFPDLVKEAVYDSGGTRVACGLNEGCALYASVSEHADDGFCMDCRHYRDCGSDFGRCMHKAGHRVVSVTE